MSPLSLGVEKIHACLNHCILYRNEYKNATWCPRCKHSRYKRNDEYVVDDNDKKSKKEGEKRKKVTTCHVDNEDGTKSPSLVMWYLPVVDRLRRLFANPRGAAMMTWHMRKAMRSFDIQLTQLSGKTLT